jgi:hypothetical protein
MLDAYAMLMMYEAECVAKLSPEEQEAYYARKKRERLRDKDSRMDRRLKRHREQIWKRNWMFVGLTAFWLTVPVAAVAGVSALWRFCAWVIAY